MSKYNIYPEEERLPKDPVGWYQYCTGDDPVEKLAELPIFIGLNGIISSDKGDKSILGPGIIIPPSSPVPMFVIKFAFWVESPVVVLPGPTASIE